MRRAAARTDLKKKKPMEGRQTTDQDTTRRYRRAVETGVGLATSLGLSIYYTQSAAAREHSLTLYFDDYTKRVGRPSHPATLRVLLDGI
jgi:hypothetical protein